MERISYPDLPENFFTPLRQVEDYIETSGLDSNLLNLVRLRISQINACAYCLDMHYKELKHGGETDLRLSMLAAWEETEFFTEQEKAVLAYGEALTVLRCNDEISECFEALHIYYSKAEISFISLAVTQINTWNRLMRSFNFRAGYFKVN